MWRDLTDRARAGVRWWLTEADPAPVAAYLIVWLWAYSLWMIAPHDPDPFEALKAYRELRQVFSARAWGLLGLASATAALATWLSPSLGRWRHAGWVPVSTYWGTIAWTMALSQPASTGTPAYALAAAQSLWVLWRVLLDAQRRSS